MRLALVVAVWIALAPLGLASGSVHDRNVAYLWSLLGEHDPAEPATMHDGRVVSLAQAIDEAASRAGNVDLAALAAGAAPSYLDLSGGDIWVLEYGLGGCQATWLVPPVVFVPVPLDPQFWLYVSGVGEISTTHGSYTRIIGWTLKTDETRYGTSGFWARGLTDGFCFAFAGFHFAYPFLDGTAGLH